MNQSVSFEELIRKFEQLRDHFSDDREKNLRELQHSKDDARLTVYSKTINVLNSVQISFVFVHNCLLRDQYWDAIYKKRLSVEDKQIMVNEFINFTKIGFVQGLFLSIESSLRLFLKAIDTHACNNGTAEFKSIYDCLFRSKLKNNPSDGTELLDLFRLVRNTIHNNGVYFHKEGNDKILFWKGERYEFKQGLPIDFVTWDFLLNISEELRAMLYSIVTDDNIKLISNEIYDPFSRP